MIDSVVGAQVRITVVMGRRDDTKQLSPKPKILDPKILNHDFHCTLLHQPSTLNALS